MVSMGLQGAPRLRTPTSEKSQREGLRTGGSGDACGKIAPKAHVVATMTLLTRERWSSEPWEMVQMS